MNYRDDAQRASRPGAASTRDPAGPGVGKRTQVMDLPRGGGQPLPAAVKTKMERSFGADFSAVRIHQDGHASALGALGYTQGNDIHFAPGQYQPETPQGLELLGHELAHVVQQSQGRVEASGQAKGLPLNGDPGLEHEADAAGDRAARGEPAGLGPGGAATGTTIQMMGGETIRQICKTLGIGLVTAGVIYWTLPATISVALATGGVTALSEYWFDVVARLMGTHDPGTGGLGLGFTDVHDHEDAFGNKTKVNGNLGKFRSKLNLTALAPALTPSQTQAASKLVSHPIGELKGLDTVDDGVIQQYGRDHVAFVQTLREVQQAGLTNLQIGELCNCYLRVIELLIGADGSKQVVRVVTGLDDKQPSSLSAAIMSAMYREPFIRSNLAGFSEAQIDWAREHSPVLLPPLADEARLACGQQLRNDDCNLWNAMHRTPTNWPRPVTLISVWELAMLIHTPELKAKTKFYNYNTNDPQPSTKPLGTDWVFTGKGSK